MDETDKARESFKRMSQAAIMSLYEILIAHLDPNITVDAKRNFIKNEVEILKSKILATLGY
jgi:hypothetical protein